jgi:protein-S-isoprenylcysteine O-methyltransferase Ste14
VTVFDIALHILIPALWIAWCACWIAAAPFAKATRWREAPGLRLLDRVSLLLCAILFAAPRLLPGLLSARFVARGAALPLLGSVMVAAGLGFAAWARWHIGRNWSGTVSLKQGHTLVCSGPYHLVRHPIYTGMLLALIGTALAIGEWRGPLAVVFALLAFVRRIRVEEQRMRQTFPEYEQYRRTTPALIPRLF